MSDEPLLPNGYTIEQTMSCTNRGKQKGFKNKGGCSCQAKNRETVWRCSLHTLCTMNRYSKNQEETICSTCNNVSPKEPT